MGVNAFSLNRPFIGYRILYIGVMLLILSVGVKPCLSQEGEEPPPRGVLRGDPPYTPQILHREVLPNNTHLTVVQLPAVADSYIASERPTQNFGADALFLGYNLVGDNFGAERILLRFDLGGIPATATVHEAYLRLDLNFSSPGDDDPMGTILRRTASSWDEYEVTWQREPSWGEIRASTDISSVLKTYEWEITDLVADWVTGIVENYGMEIIGDEQVQQQERAFYARETTTGSSPYLIINYTVSDDRQSPIVTVDPLSAYSPRSFTVSWHGEDQGGAGIHHYDVQYRVGEGDWIDWFTEVEFTSAEYRGHNGHLYEFRARGVDNVDNVEPWGDPEAWTVVDTQPPTSQMSPLPQVLYRKSFIVSWSGSDSVSGVHYYDVRYRVNGGAWRPWQQQTLAVSATFVAPADAIYGFEVGATDHLGLKEAFSGQSEASVIVDAQAPFFIPRVWLPLVRR